MIFRQGLALCLDPEILDVAIRSLRVSGSATMIALLIGVPLGAAVALRAFRGKNIVIALFYTGMGFPPVAIGLGVMLLLARGGPLGSLHLLYTEKAMILAQVIIALPVVAGLVYSAVSAVSPRIRLSALALGVTVLRADLAVIREARLGLWVAGIAGFGSVLSEVGAVMMVGGNITGETRVMTTAIVQEARMGRFDIALALSIILILISFIVHYALTMINHPRERDHSS